TSPRLKFRRLQTRSSYPTQVDLQHTLVEILPSPIRGDRPPRLRFQAVLRAGTDRYRPTQVGFGFTRVEVPATPRSALLPSRLRFRSVPVDFRSTTCHPGSVSRAS